MKKKIISHLFLMGIILAGCSLLTRGTMVFGQNVFVSAPVLPKNLKRVVVLPLACAASSADLSSGCAMLDPILKAALTKTRKFETVYAGSEMLRSLTGRSDWTGAEILPADFFDSLHQVYGGDAVLFCQLTVFRAYRPIAIGWRMKLVDMHTHKIIWAADEIFDASEPAVARSAEQFEKQEQNVHGETRSLLDTLVRYADREPASALADQWTILNSPRYFGRFSAQQVLQTLPARAFPAKVMPDSADSMDGSQRIKVKTDLPRFTNHGN